MKSIYTAVLCLSFFFAANARTWQVTVANFSFNPATINASVGDIVQFTWAGPSNHTTTCGSALPGTSLPPGAAEWNSAMTSAISTFSYTLTAAGNYLYGCIPHFAFGMSGTITVSGSTTPVTFGHFNVSNRNNTGLVEWNTFIESNTDYFSIRKSTDGTHFTEVGKVDAAGNSNSIITYHFTDTDLGKKYRYLYYEIVTVDIDKRENASEIKILRNNNIASNNLIVSLSPNPISRPGQVQLKFNADADGEMNVAVFSMSGQKVLETKMAAFYGLNSGHLHVCDLNKGTYTVVFQLENKRESRRVIVL